MSLPSRETFTPGFPSARPHPPGNAPRGPMLCLVPARRSAWSALPAAGAIVAGLLLASCDKAAAVTVPQLVSVEGTTVSIAPGAPQWRYVELSVAGRAEPLRPLPAPARVAVDEQRTSAIGAPLPGRVEQVRVRAGDRVEKGAKLFAIRSGEWAELEKEVRAAEASVQVKKRLAARTRELVQVQAVPEKELLLAEAEQSEAELTLQGHRTRRESLRVSPDGTALFWMVAPRAGTVVEVNVTASEQVGPDRERPLARISDLDEVLVFADVQEADAMDVAAGDAVSVRTANGAGMRPGTVEHVSELVDSQRRTVQVRIRAANADRALRPNGWVEVELQAPRDQQRIRVPAEAVVTDGPQSVIFLASAEGTLERRAVTVGRQRDGQAEIRAGLEEGARYVSRGALLLLNQIELRQ